MYISKVDNTIHYTSKPKKRYYTTKDVKKTVLTAQLTPRQKFWADEVLEGKSRTEAAMIAYNTDNKQVAANYAYKNKKNDKIIDYLSLNALPAMKRIEHISRASRNEMVKLKANQDIVDRAGYKPVERIQDESITLLLDKPYKAVDKVSGLNTIQKQ